MNMQWLIKFLLLGVSVMALTSCQSTLENSIRDVSGVMNKVRTGSVKTITDIASSDDPSGALKSVADRRVDAYKQDPAALLDDIDTVKRDFSQLVALLQGNVTRQWGKKEVRVASKKQYIKYTQNYLSRAIVDFDKGEIMVETLDQSDPSSSLQSAIVTTLLTPDDPRAVDLFSDKTITLSSDQPPYLSGLVLDQQGRGIEDPQSAERYAQHLLTQKQLRKVEVDGVKKQAAFVKFAMVSNFSHKQAQKYSGLVNRYASEYNISPSLIYAVIRAESNFNPYAVSSAPAYGLMQLVPTSGARDAYRKAKGHDRVPDKDYLFNAQQNIELGAAYLNILAFNHLQMVQNDISREYCVISAYNTGAGNVLKAFDKDRTRAVNTLNSKTPAEVYAKLRRDLPYEETRRYLQKVVDFRKQFIAPVG
ncbi:murein transglycosylase domain-containing protein [Bowmanella dokdonensis]|nr:murein transglycosylase domain-containing protein [Bowmanella dokdonensis]